MVSRDDSHIAALQAALAAVEDWDGDLSALFGFDSDNSSSSDVTRPKKPRTRPYERPKQEIASLRAEIAELENVIALEKTLVHDSPEINGPTIEEAALKQEWQRLASTQKHERFVSQLENARLRKQLQSQTKNMEKILNLLKRMRLLEEVLPELSAPSFDDYRMPSIDAQAHLQRLVSLLPYAVEIFSSSKFVAEGLQCFRDIHVRGSTPAVNGADFDIKAAWVLPFPVDRVTDALWLHTMRPSFEPTPVAFMDVYEDASSLVSHFISSKSQVRETHGQLARKMFPADPVDGSVLIGFAIKVRAYINGKWAASAHVDGWLQIKSVVATGNANAESPTQVKLHQRMIIVPPDSADMSPTERCMWTNFVISGPSRNRFEEDLDFSLQAIENLLLTPKPNTP